jgi:two-component system, LytTR family, sensor kinase
VPKQSLVKTQLFFTAILWWAVISVVYSLILTGTLKSFHLTTIQIVTDALISNVLLGGCCLLIINNMRYYLPRQEKYWYVIIISLGLSAVSTLVARVTLWFIFMHDEHYNDALAQSGGIRFGISCLLIACMAILSLLWYTHKEQKTANDRKTDVEKLAREAELFKLRQQLQPHFLFNSLNSINALIGTQPEQARKMINQLSDFLRGTLKKEDQQWVILSDEFQYLELYLDIEKVRFGHRLSSSINSEEETQSMKLPPMLLQPIVENAIKFGLYDTMGDVTISIDAKKIDGYLIITVQNPFDPETSHPKKGTGFGLSSVQRRLYLLFARNDLLETKVDNNLFTTVVKIPQL